MSSAGKIHRFTTKLWMTSGMVTVTSCKRIPLASWHWYFILALGGLVLWITVRHSIHTPLQSYPGDFIKHVRSCIWITSVWRRRASKNLVLGEAYHMITATCIEIIRPLRSYLALEPARLIISCAFVRARFVNQVNLAPWQSQNIQINSHGTLLSVSYILLIIRVMNVNKVFIELREFCRCYQGLSDLSSPPTIMNGSGTASNDDIEVH